MSNAVIQHADPAPPIPFDELYGLLAEFDGPDEVLEAARRAYAAGYREMEAYTPIPVHGLTEALGQVPTKLPLLTFAGGVLGAIAGYGLQYWAMVISYPMNVGGRPYHSWPAFMPVVFEMTVLGAALFSVLGMLALNGLPMPYHPTFNVPAFKLASRNRFFLSIRAADVKFDRDSARRFLEDLRPLAVYEVPK
jgi:hypothetical protein